MHGIHLKHSKVEWVSHSPAKKNECYDNLEHSQGFVDGPDHESYIT